MLLESILKKIFGDPNAKELKNIQVIVDKINALEPEMQKLSDAELRDKTRLEAELARVTRTRLCTLVSTGGRAAVARTCTAADPFIVMR